MSSKTVNRIVARDTLVGILSSILAGVLVSLLLALLVLAASSASANNDTGEASTSHGNRDDVGLILRDGKGGKTMAPLLETRMEVNVTGIVAHTTVLQRFSNRSDSWVEGVYVFPLPDQAAVDHLRMRVGSRSIEGEIREKAKARKLYQKAASEGKRAALLEQERPNIFTASVANIAPGDEITVEIEFQLTVQYQQGEFSLQIPTVVGPRYMPGEALVFDTTSGSGWARDTSRVPDASRISPPVLHGYEQRLNHFSLQMALDSGLPIATLYSPTHQVDVNQIRQGRYAVSLRNSGEILDRDMRVVWRPVYGEHPEATVLTEEHDGAYYHLVMVVPPSESGERMAVLPREAIFVVDTSGSMHGASIGQAKNALYEALDKLNSGDRFNIIQFNSTIGRLFHSAQPATAESVALAREYVSTFEAGGGTEMAQALYGALHIPAYQSQGHASATSCGNGKCLRQVIFLTDGSVGNEDELFGIVRDHIGDSRLFMVGIGAAPNAYLLRKSAALGRGRFSFIGDIGEVEQKMTDLFVSLERPAMRDIEYQWSGDGEVELIPEQIPDLYYGDALVFTARTSSPHGFFSLSGRIHNREWQQSLPVQTVSGPSGVSELWARNRMAQLKDQMGLIYDEDDKQAIKQQIIGISKHHHVVSQYTSLIAVEKVPVRPVFKPLKKTDVPVHLPDGWSYHKVFGGLPQTATTAGLQMLIGVVLILLALLFYVAGASRGKNRFSTFSNKFGKSV